MIRFNRLSVFFDRRSPSVSIPVPIDRNGVGVIISTRHKDGLILETLAIDTPRLASLLTALLREADEELAESEVGDQTIYAQAIVVGLTASGAGHRDFALLTDALLAEAERHATS